METIKKVINGFTKKFKEGYQSINDISIEVSELVRGIWATPPSPNW